MTTDSTGAPSAMRVDGRSEAEFPKKGTQSTDFLPPNGLFEIQYEAEGDLNGDGLADKALVLRQDAEKSAERPMLILVQTQGKTYHLDKISTTAMPPENDENGYRSYDDETISIVNGVLHIELYSTGPQGNLHSQFKYFEKDLLLTRVEAQNIGAGSHQTLVYNLLTGELAQEVTNTLDEDMSSEPRSIILQEERHLFDSVSPDAVISKAYRQLEKEKE